MTRITKKKNRKMRTFNFFYYDNNGRLLGKMREKTMSLKN